MLEWMWMMIGGTFAWAIMFMYRNIIIKKSWPISTPVAIQRGNSVIWDLEERGKYLKSKTGYEIVKLKKRNTNIKPPKFSDTGSDTRGKPVYFLYNSTVGQYFPIRMGNSPKFEVVEDTSAKNWGILELNRIRQTYMPKESIFLKFAPYIMNATFAAMVIFFVIYFGGKVEGVATALSGAAGSLNEAIGRLAAAPPSPSAPVVP